MYLEQVDIDAFFPHRKVMVGPLSPGLNAIFGEAGAGKTAIIDFLRAVMLGGMRWNTSTAGRVVWCDTDGLLVCRREVDGTADGRLTFERLGRDGRSVFEGHAAIQGKQLAAEWIDAIVCPLGNALEQSRRALAAARHAGIEVAGRDEETPEYRATRLRLKKSNANSPIAVMASIRSSPWNCAANNCVISYNVCRPKLIKWHWSVGVKKCAALKASGHPPSENCIVARHNVQNYCVALTPCVMNWQPWRRYRRLGTSLCFDRTRTSTSRRPRRSFGPLAPHVA